MRDYGSKLLKTKNFLANYIVLHLQKICAEEF